MKPVTAIILYEVQQCGVVDIMPEQVVAVDYERCQPDSCGESGICAASLVCEYGSLTQQSPYEEPDVIPSKWCHGCAKCVKACPLKAIRMIG